MWSAGESATAYWLDVGTALGQGNISAGNLGTARSKLVTGLPVNSSTVYVSLYSLINGSWQGNNYTYTAVFDPRAAMISPAPRIDLQQPVRDVHLDHRRRALSAYWLDVGTAPGQGNIAAGNLGTATSRTVSGIPVNGSTIYVNLYSNINGTWYGNSYTYKAAFSVKAAMLTPAPGSILSSSSRHLHLDDRIVRLGLLAGCGYSALCRQHFRRQRWVGHFQAGQWIAAGRQHGVCNAIL